MNEELSDKLKNTSTEERQRAEEEDLLIALGLI